MQKPTLKAETTPTPTDTTTITSKTLSLKLTHTFSKEVLEVEIIGWTSSSFKVRWPNLGEVHMFHLVYNELMSNACWTAVNINEARDEHRRLRGVKFGG